MEYSTKNKNLLDLIFHHPVQHGGWNGLKRKTNRGLMKQWFVWLVVNEHDKLSVIICKHADQ